MPTTKRGFDWQDSSAFLSGPVSPFDGISTAFGTHLLLDGQADFTAETLARVWVLLIPAYEHRSEMA